MKKIKRMAAVLVAVCLMMGLLCAAFAEETKENISNDQSINTGAAAESAVQDAGESIPETTPAPETGSTDGTGEAAGETGEIPWETPTVTDEEGYEHFISDEAPEYCILDNGGGTVAPEVIAEQLPEVTPEMIEASNHVVETPAPETEQPPKAETAAVRAWITDKKDESEAVILKANVNPALEGKVTWQVHDAKWQEDKWEDIGSGDQLTLDPAKVNNGSLVRFRLENGTVSETYEVKIVVQEEPMTDEPAAEEPATEEAVTEEPVTEEPETVEPITEEPVTEEPATDEPVTEEPVTEEPATEEPETEEPVTEEPITEEPVTEEPVTEEPVTEEPVTEEPATEEPETVEPANEEPVTEEPTTEEPVTEEPAAEEPAGDEPGNEGPAEGCAVTDENTEGINPAGETDDTEGFDEEPGEPVTLRAWVTGIENAQAGETVTLSANAEPALTGVSTWQIRNEQVEDGKWKKAGYGDRLTVELEAGNEYRFVMQDGTVSEVLRLAAAAEEANDETGTEEPDEAGSEAEEAAGEETDEAELTEEGNGEEPGETGDAVTEETGEAPEGTDDEEPEEPGEEVNGEEAETEAAGDEAAEAPEDGEETEGEPDAGAAELTEEPEETAETAETEDAEDAETSEETGEEAEAEGGTTEGIPAEDGEEITEEAAEERTLPEGRSAAVRITWDEEEPGLGSVAHFTAELSGYEELNYTVQWITSTDNENWTEVEGASGETMDVVVTEENYRNYWRIRVHIEGFKDVQ